MTGDPRSRTAFQHAGWLTLAAAVLAVAGCGQKNDYVPPPPPDVVVGLPVQHPVTIYSEFTGTTQASEMVAVRSRVQGYLASLHFADGCDVKEGDLLFTIDPRPYEAKLDQTKADLESKLAVAARSEAMYKRTLTLFRTGASGQEDLDKDRGDWGVAKAGVTQARANVREAQLNLDWTIVRAPISGRISRRLVDVGNMVTADTTVLTTITRYDPMYAYFTVSETDLVQYLKRLRETPPGSLEASPSTQRGAIAAGIVALGAASPRGCLAALAGLRLSTPRYPVEMSLANQSSYTHRGFIDFADNAIDSGTGTLQVRGTFRNPPPYDLAPGLFVHLRVPVGSRERATLVPDRAVGSDQAGQYVLVVGPDDTVERRLVKLGPADGDMRVIEKGLQPSDRFIVDGLQRAQPGSKVHPVENAQAMASTEK